MAKLNIKDFSWTREPQKYTVSEDRIEIITQPHIDLRQRTYYHFRNGNAPILQVSTGGEILFFHCKSRIGK